ncbi:MAG TPA: hypothetical protein VGD17_15155 [Chitinophagaceae bacterium]
MTRIKLCLLSLSMVFFILQSCTKDKMDETGTVYNGSPLIEFAHLTGTMNRTVAYTTASPAEMKDSVKIQLIGPQRSTPTTITFEVDAAGTTGTAGVDYVNLTTTGNTAVIPANQSLVWLVFNFIRPAAGTKTLKLNLVSGDNVGLSANYKSMVFTWKK